MINTFFKDLKVIEFASILAGPSVGTFFKELGADVIKIENAKTNGDLTRNWKLASEDKDNPHSIYYASVNGNKKSVLLNLDLPSDRNIAQEYVKDAHILISNFNLQAARAFGLDYSTIQRINPAIIYAQLYAFPDQPNRPAYDLVLQAEAGYLSMNGSPQAGPAKMPVAFIDLFAGHQLKEAILIGLLNKAKTGSGCYIEVDLYSSAISALANQGSNYLMGGHIPSQMGILHPNIAPYGEIIYSSDMKGFVLAAGSDKNFMDLCKILSCPELCEDIRYKTNQDRVINRATLISILQKFAKNIHSDYLRDMLNSRQIPMGEMNNLQQVFMNQKALNCIDTEQGVSGEIRRPRQIVFRVSTS